jgi:hypothetical protein
MTTCPLGLGNGSGYTNHGCRCTECTEAHSADVQAYRSTPEGRAAVRASNERARRRKALAAKWVRENRPDVWADINAEVDK